MGIILQVVAFKYYRLTESFIWVLLMGGKYLNPIILVIVLWRFFPDGVSILMFWHENYN